MKKQIKDFIQLKNFERYDFTNHCLNEKEYIDKEGYVKYFSYREYTKKKDPDTESQLLQEIYKLLWPELINKEYMIDKAWIKSDTMTSAQNILSQYVQQKFPEEIKDYKLKYPRQRMSSKMCQALYEQYPSVQKNLEDNIELKKFISLYHSIGNYTPVPKQFNVPRSGPGFDTTYDCWDLTLIKIKAFFDLKYCTQRDKRTIVIEELLHTADKIENTTLWLNSFSSWEDFVDKNYFNIYVDENYELVDFCDGRSWNNTKITDFDKFLKSLNSAIESRGKKIGEIIEQKLNEKETQL